MSDQRHAKLGPELEEVAAARGAALAEIDHLEAAGRTTLDVRSSLRRDPLSIAGLAAGTGFVLFGGPQRAWRAVRSRIRPKPSAPDLPPGLSRIFAGLGEDGVEAARELAGLVTPVGQPRRRSSRLGGILRGSVFVPLGIRWARQLAGKLLEVDPDAYRRNLEAVRKAREAATTRSEARPAAPSETPAATITPRPGPTGPDAPRP